VHEGGRWSFPISSARDFEETAASSGASDGVVESLRAVAGVEMSALIRSHRNAAAAASVFVHRVIARRLGSGLVRAVAADIGRQPGLAATSVSGADRLSAQGVRRQDVGRGGVAVAIPRALEPSGLVLVDKPSGPSSFALVRDLRSKTGARAGHAGTLDPSPVGSCFVLLGSATRLARYLVVSTSVT